MHDFTEKLITIYSRVVQESNGQTLRYQHLDVFLATYPSWFLGCSVCSSWVEVVNPAGSLIGIGRSVEGIH